MKFLAGANDNNPIPMYDLANVEGAIRYGRVVQSGTIMDQESKFRGCVILDQYGQKIGIMMPRGVGLSEDIRIGDFGKFETKSGRIVYSKR